MGLPQTTALAQPSVWVWVWALQPQPLGRGALGMARTHKGPEVARLLGSGIAKTVDKGIDRTLCCKQVWQVKQVTWWASERGGGGC